ERQSANRIMAAKRAGKGEIGTSGLFFLLRFFQSLNLPRDDQLRVWAQLHALLLGKTFGAFANKVDMGTLVQNQARGLDGIADSPNTPRPRGATRGPSNRARVGCHSPSGGENPPGPGEKFSFFSLPDNRSSPGVGGKPAAPQNIPPLVDGFADPPQMRVTHI